MGSSRRRPILPESELASETYGMGASYWEASLETLDFPLHHPVGSPDDQSA